MLLLTMADGLYRFPCPVCLRLFDSRRGLGAHLRQSQCGADIVVDPQGPTLVIPPFPPPPTPSPRVAPQGGTPASSRVFASAVQSPQSPCENIETSRRAASLLSPTPFAASPEPAPPDYDAAKDAKDISSFWSSHSPFCPPLAAVPAACRARYPLLWFAKTPRPAVVGAVSLEVVAAAAVSVFDIAERLRVASGNYADWSAEIKRIIASFATVSSAPVPGSALQADFTRAVLAAGEDVKSLRSVPASRLWTIALLAMWRHPSFEQEAPAIHHRLIVASSVAPVSNPEIAEEELFFGRRPLSFDVGGRLVRTSPADSGATSLGEPRQTTHISLPLGLHPQPPTFSPSSTPTRDLVNEVNQNFDKIIARFRAASLSASQPPSPPPNVSAAAAPALGPHLSSSAPREESIGVSPTSATVPSLPAISPAVVVPATTPLARHFRVREGKPLLVEWVGPDAQSCPLCPARPVGRNCYASHMSRCHQGEAAVTSREHFATVIEEGSAEVRWVGFAPTRIPKPTEAMSRLVPAPCLATYASLAVGDWVRYALLFGGVSHFCRGCISRLCRQTGRIFMRPRGETEERAIPLEGLDALELLDAIPLGSCVPESAIDKDDILAWLRPRTVGHTFSVRLRHGETISKWYGRLTTPRRAVLLASENRFLEGEINVDLAAMQLMDVLSLDSAAIPDFERVGIPPPPPQPTYRTQRWTCGFFVEWVGGDGVSQHCPFCSFSCARLKNFSTHLREHRRDTRVVSSWLSWTGPRSCAEMLRLGVCRGCGTHSNLKAHIPRCQRASEKMSRFRQMHATGPIHRFRLDGVAADSPSSSSSRSRDPSPPHAAPSPQRAADPSPPHAAPAPQRAADPSPPHAAPSPQRAADPSPPHAAPAPQRAADPSPPHAAPSPQRAADPSPPHTADEGDYGGFTALAPTEIARGVMQSAAEVETFFRLRNGPVPTVAQLLGRDGARLELLDLRHIPRLAARGIALKVRQRHLAMLRKLRDLDSDLLLLPLDAALAEQMLRWKDRLRWRWATLERNMTTMAGALSSLRLYSRHPISVSLGASHLWGAAMRAAAIKAREEEPRAPRPAKWEQVVRIVDDVSLPIWMRQVLLICWLTAARPGCVLQLKAEDLQVSLASEQTLLPFAVIFRRGKGARLRGPYTVHSALQARFLPLLRPLVEGSGYLFPAESANHREQMARRLLAAVRAVDGSLELRSLRRGSLETLSRLGVDERELMQFSGHTQIATLRRYLRWGRADAVASSRALHQAELLTSSPVSGPASPPTTT